MANEQLRIATMGSFDYHVTIMYIHYSLLRAVVIVDVFCCVQSTQVTDPVCERGWISHSVEAPTVPCDDVVSAQMPLEHEEMVSCTVPCIINLVDFSNHETNAHQITEGNCWTCLY